MKFEKLVDLHARNQVTLDSGIDVGPTFINFGFFFQALRPY